MGIAENLKRLRKEKGLSQPRLAEKSGVSQQLISQIESGRNETTNKLPSLARALGVRVADIDPAYEGVADEVVAGVEGLVPVRRAGTVEAGSFRRVDEFEDEGDFVELFEPRDKRFPDARQAYFDVAGDSMNALKPRPILDGDRVICIDYDDLKGRLPLRDGMVVVVEQTLAGGHIRERSIKQLELYTDRWEFHPRSTNPKHKPIVTGVDLQADDGRTVEVIAIVRRVTNDLPI
jgi:transcriptional regulator with XRE-family HTH domain